MHDNTHAPLSPPHHLALGRSRVLAALLLAGHLMIIVALPLVRPDWMIWSISLAYPWIMLSLYHAMTLHAWRTSPRAVVRIEVARDGQVTLEQRNGLRAVVSLMDSSTVHPWLVVLNVRAAGGVRGPRWSRSVIVASDACDTADLRRMRAWLRWGHRTNSEEDEGAR